MKLSLEDTLLSAIRTIPDYPKPGILFRDINPRRTLCDQYFSRRVISRAGIIINTGEDNYITTADAYEAAHTVIASQFINECFAKRAGLKDWQLGIGHSYEIDPHRPDTLLPKPTLYPEQRKRGSFDVSTTWHNNPQLHGR